MFMVQSMLFGSDLVVGANHELCYIMTYVTLQNKFTARMVNIPVVQLNNTVFVNHQLSLLQSYCMSILFI